MIAVVWLIIAAAAVGLDQLTKAIVVEKLMPIGSAPFVKGIIRFQYVENTGAAFGMMKDHRWFFLIFSSVAIALMIALLIVYRKKIHPFLGVIIAMIIGGGIGNQIDRFVQGYVVDFLDFEFMNFAVFNVADIFVSVGAFLGIVYLLFFETNIFGKKDVKTAEKADQAADSGKVEAAEKTEEKNESTESEMKND